MISTRLPSRNSVTGSYLAPLYIAPQGMSSTLKQMSRAPRRGTQVNNVPPNHRTMPQLARFRPYAAALITVLAGATPLAAQSAQPNRQVLDSIAGSGILENRAVGMVAAVVKGNDTLLFKAYGKA